MTARSAGPGRLNCPIASATGLRIVPLGTRPSERHATVTGRGAASQGALPARWGAAPASGLESACLISQTRSVNVQPSGVRW